MLKKKLKEVKKAKDKAKQDGYDIGVAETEEALRPRSQGYVETIASKWCL